MKRVRSCRLGVYNADFERTMRRFLKGDIDCSPEDVALCLRRNGVRQSYVNFMADQDGFTLADLVSYEEKHNEANGEGGRDGTDQNFSWNCGEEGDSRKHTVRSLRRQQLRNAVLLLMTSQGAPLLYAGDEVLNSQEGNNNAWCQDNSLGWVNWKRTRDARSMLSFVRACIQFRKDHPVLHQSLPLRMEDYKKTGYPDLSYHGHSAWVHQSGQTKAGIGVLYCGEYAEKAPGVPDDMIYIAYNMHWRPQEFAVPDLKKPMRWYRKADTSREDCFIPDENLQPEELLSGKVMEVPARTIVILIGKA